LRPLWSQETAQLEADAFVRRQQVALAAEVKAVLDSWVRFEQQEKENEQARLVKTIVDNVLKNVSEEKTQKDVLAWAVSEVDRECPVPFPFQLAPPLLTTGGDDVAELVKNKAI
jgi:hypothetical protein